MRPFFKQIAPLQRMGYRLIYALLALALGVSACSGAASIPAATVDSTRAAPSCRVVNVEPTLSPTMQAAFPPVNNKDWAQGKATAFVTIIEYGDFQ